MKKYNEDKEKVIINVYDFDKTIYNGDSTIDFYLYCIKIKPKILLFLPINVIFFIAFKVNIIEKIKFKEKFFSFLKYIDNVEDVVNKFWVKKISKIKKWFYEDKKENKIIISASPEFLLYPIMKDIGVKDLIASKVDKNTGKFNTPNCYGEEKVRRINEKYKNYIINSFYSDSLSDIYLARLARKSYLVKKDKIIDWKV